MSYGPIRRLFCVFRWLRSHARFDITCFPAFVWASDILSSILLIHLYSDSYKNTLGLAMFNLAPMASASGKRLAGLERQATKQSRASWSTRLPVPVDVSSKSWATLPHHVIRSLNNISIIQEITHQADVNYTKIIIKITYK